MYRVSGFAEPLMAVIVGPGEMASGNVAVEPSGLVSVKVTGPVAPDATSIWASIAVEERNVHDDGWGDDGGELVEPPENVTPEPAGNEPTAPL